MKYLNASQAAKRIGISDKTIRRWLKEGKVSAIRISSNQLAIPESEVEELRRERAQFVQNEEQDVTSLDQMQDINALVSKVAELEQKIAILEKERTEKPIEPSTPVLTNHASPPSDGTKKRSYTRSESIPDDLPEGTITHFAFAKQHSVNPRTFSDQIMVGIGRGKDEKDRVEAIVRPKLNRPDETDKYLTPEQQEKALDYWRKHGAKFTE